MPDTRRLEALAAQLPDPEALRELRALGFATIVYHPLGVDSAESGAARAAAARARSARDLRAFEREAARAEADLRPLLSGPRLAAWSLRPSPPGPQPGPEAARAHGRAGANDTESDQPRR
jgi:hypothetical protein